jgi:Leucine-rich repeat (LRR) protein
MQLQSLNVSSNKLRVLTREIGSCSKLLVLNLSSNELQVLPDELGAIKSLHILDVSHNKVCGNTTYVSTLHTLALYGSAFTCNAFYEYIA